MSDVDEMSSPVRSQRPKTAPGYGRRTTTFERPHQAWVEKAETDVREQVVYLPNGIRVQGDVTVASHSTEVVSWWACLIVQ